MEKQNNRSTIYVAPEIKVIIIEPLQALATSTETFSLDEGAWD